MVNIKSESGENLYSIYEMAKILNISKSTMRRDLIKNMISYSCKFKNIHLYSENEFFKIIHKKIINQNE